MGENDARGKANLFEGKALVQERLPIEVVAESLARGIGALDTLYCGVLMMCRSSREIGELIELVIAVQSQQGNMGYCQYEIPGIAGQYFRGCNHII